MADEYVRVRGARHNNLNDIDVDIPRDRFVAFTGVSGSGKSSLAFATIYAEAQRRYLESTAPYARRLINQASAPAVDEITGLPPAVALSARHAAANSRSSVGTLTSLSNYLRMLFSRAGDYPPDMAPVDSDAFSPNTAVGACPACQGLGTIHTTTETSLVPDPSLTIRERAVAAWPGAWQGKNYRDILATLGYDVDVPWSSLSQTDRDWILFTDEQPVVTVHPVREAHRIQRPYKGTYMSARRYIMHTLATTKSATQRKRALQFVETSPCTLCRGARLAPSSLAVTFAGRNIAQFGALQLDQVATILRPLCERPGDDPRAQAARMICSNVVSRIDSLVELGLGYLALDRTTSTLSSGELQRLRLATQLRAGLFGVVYVLDEPSAGLHPADAQHLLRTLRQLTGAGNSLFVVEHDMDLVRAADWIVELGPDAGAGGGNLLYSGPLDGLADVKASPTRPFIQPHSDFTAAPRLQTPDVTDSSRWLTFTDLHKHNLQNISLRIPRDALTTITGPSGSGKTTAVTLMGERAAEQVDRVVQVDQRPIGRTPRSNLATYTGLFDAVRKLFAATPEAQARGYGAGHFSFNVKGGRCETCQGEGFVSIELLFMPGTYGPCPVCHGTRYNAATLDIRWHGKNVAEVLDLSVDEAAQFFAEVNAVARSLATLQDVGVGYLHLGQPATELSGGEAQRIKLASELQRTQRGHTLYILDEPTAGLHPRDVQVLIRMLHHLVDLQNTVLVVEHDMQVAAASHWVIDLGPAGGMAGGRVVASDTPTGVSSTPMSRTAPFLRAALGAADGVGTMTG